MCLNGSANNVVSFFGSIHKMFIHEAWVGGPELCVLELDWYTNAGRAEVSGNPLVEKLPIVRTISADRYNLVQTRIVPSESQSFVLQAVRHRQLLPNTSGNMAPRSAWAPR